jgi:NAD(P)-dependent dehydrogenase (short-subunit alcohol dehydrogenase family)
MKIDLGGRTALVTGSTTGIGFGIAQGLAEAGAAVVVNGRTAPAVDEAVARLQASVSGAVISGVAADLGTATGCAQLTRLVPQTDILVNNVGIFALQDFFDATDEVWERHLAVNVLSGVRLSRAYIPQMVARGWGRVIFVSSESAINIPVEMIHYGVTKTADLALARGLAKRVAGTGVTVNALMPGPTLSQGMRDMLQQSQQRDASAKDKSVEQLAAEFVMTHRPSSLIRRAATVQEVANLAVYIASPLSSATTGAALRVDGGVVETIT